MSAPDCSLTDSDPVSYHTQRPGSRMAEEETTHMADQPPYPGGPRWLRIFGIAASAIALLLIALIHVGGAPHHGMPSFGGPAAQENSH